MLSVIMLSVVMLSVVILSVVTRYAESCQAECYYAECHYAECHGAFMKIANLKRSDHLSDNATLHNDLKIILRSFVNTDKDDGSEISY